MRKEINLFLTTILLLFSICENCFSITRYVTSNLNLRYEANTHSYIIIIMTKNTHMIMKIFIIQYRVKTF